MSTVGEQLTALRSQAAARPGWGPRTIGRLSTRVALSGAIEWLALVYIADDDDQRRARHALTGIGATDDEALEALRKRLNGEAES